MANTPVHNFRIVELPGHVLATIRARGTDVSGNTIQRIDAGGGEPLRCCLRDAKPRERLMLFGYEPPIPLSPYREVGPVLAHAQGCDGPGSAAEYPPDFYGRPQTLRAYDERGWIHPATRVHDGSSPVAAIMDVLADPTVVQIHSRNVAWGCYMFTITRGS